MTNGLRASLREAPATAPALAAVALFVVWATSQAGYPLTHWAPGGLFVLALLGVAIGVVGVRPAEIPTPVRIALICLAGFTAFSYLSILWAAAPAEAWEGANRTLLYLLVFTLFCSWRQNGRSAALLLCAWTLAMVAIAAFALLHLDAASRASLQNLIPGGRLAYPSGYPNASAAQWLMAFWPALLLARSARLPWGLRGVLAGGAVLLAEVALLSQSRGSLFATPVMVVLVFALLPERIRTFALSVPVAAGIAAAAPAVLHVGGKVNNGAVVPSAVHSAVAAAFAAAAIVAVVVALGAAIERRREFSQASTRRIRRGVGAIAIATLVVAIAGAWVAAGDPVARIRHGWHTFKGGYAADATTGSRLVSGLGSNRYDFYRVALDEFVAHPLVGIGADNFERQYLVHGHSDETPHYPHSVELRTLSQTGLAGGLLALIGLGAALLAGSRAIRPSLKREDPLAAAVAAAALGGFAYWLVHGSVDWFWEFAGLGAPAFALLGLACSLAPARSEPPGREAGVSAAAGATSPAAAEPEPETDLAPEARTPSARAARRLGVIAGVLAALAVSVSFVAPWLSQLEVQSAARVWPAAPQRAYSRLKDAARLNPLSDQAYVVAGSIALRLGDLARANREFALALGRTPGDAYATLELGAIASSRGQRRVATGLLEEALRLSPRDPLARQALLVVQKGGRIDVNRLNRSILLKAQQIA